MYMYIVHNTIQLTITQKLSMIVQKYKAVVLFVTNIKMLMNHCIAFTGTVLLELWKKLKLVRDQ